MSQVKRFNQAWIPLNVVEAMSSKVILMMPKNQESSKIQRFKNQVSRFKNQVSRFKNNQDQDSRLKIQESREDSIKISTKKVFQNIE